MPWRATSPMDQRRLFINDHRHSVFPFTELCARYGISRKTGYKWIARFEGGGYPALADNSRRPRSCAHQTPTATEAAILDVRRRHPLLGAKKLLKLCRRRQPKWTWPARSTTCSILKRNGLIPEVRHRRQPGHPGRPMKPMNAPNEIWTADFKGEFKTLDGLYCYPLTIADGFSRYLFDCRALLSPATKPPSVISPGSSRSTACRGSSARTTALPFASIALGRLSRLSVWWIKLGIFPELTEPASPQQNGRHERMHKTSNRLPFGLPPRTFGLSSDASTVSGRSSTMYDPMRLLTKKPRLHILSLATALPHAPAEDGIPCPFRAPSRQPQRRHPLETPLGERHLGTDGRNTWDSRRWTTGFWNVYLWPYAVGPVR